MKLNRLMIAILSATACTKQDQPATQPAETAAAGSIDPCTFITKGQLESALGDSFDSGKPTQGEPSCTFLSETGGTVTVALPTANVSEADFNSWKQMAGAQAESVTGIGDAAYFWGSRLYARVGTRTFTISLADKEPTPDIRTALTTLGKEGAASLR